METPILLSRRHAAIARLLKIHLQSYPEHVIAQAIREAWKVLTLEPHSAHRAISAGERHAQARMARTRGCGP
jgi:hypothetical protein